MYSPYFSPPQIPVKPTLSVPVEMPPLRDVDPKEALEPGRKVWKEPPADPPKIKSGPKNKPELCTSGYLVSLNRRPKLDRNLPPSSRLKEPDD